MPAVERSFCRLTLLAARDWNVFQFAMRRCLKGEQT